MQWETVIGLEVHAQLSTASKMFSGASTAFGSAPNTNACAVDIALPGVLPVLNRAAVEKAVRLGLAVGASINRRSVFARKNYFYPDLPKGYQISQYELPVVQGGSLSILVAGKEKIVRLTRAHLEEDAGIYFQLWEDNEKLGHKAGETVFLDEKLILDKKRAVGGDIAPSIIAYHVENEGLITEEAGVFTPPLLYGEGKKVQSEWAFEFLKEPFDLRPWLNIKMPTFSLPDEEATSLAGFFAVKENEEYPFEYIAETKKEYIEAKEAQSPGYLSAAKRLFESKDVNCILCHVKGEKMPEGDKTGWAPDLMLAKRRLKPDWIKRWLLDPQSIQPGTKMPKFFREGEFQDYIPGTPQEQTEVMKDYLMNLWE